jgi:hypothetical protein
LLKQIKGAGVLSVYSSQDQIKQVVCISVSPDAGHRRGLSA